MTGRGTNTYLLGDREVAVVDPGPDLPEHIEAILAAVGETGGAISLVLVTHGHSDHLPGAYRLRERTGAPILGHARIPGVTRPLGDGDTVAVGGELLVAYETPGHADEHLCFWREADRLLFSGDLVVGSGTVVLSRTSGALTQYLASLRHVLALGPQTMLPGHGPVIDDAPARIQEYLDHRALRERQIVEALRHGPATVDELVARLYVETPKALYPMAARNVEAHLEHLAALGRVVGSAETRSDRFRLSDNAS
jgi:glyoxylase-like metal-dependent hydrolase (beta-lactamase superfamily II)